MQLTKWSELSRTTRVRLVAAFVIAVLSAALFVASRYDEGLRTCETKRVSEERRTKLPEETCKPYPIADFAPVLLLLFVLAWPVLGEIEIAGLGRVVRRKLDEQSDKQDELSEKQEQLAQGQEKILNQIQTIQISSQEQNVNVTLADQTNLVLQVSELQARVDALESGKPPPELPREAPRVVDSGEEAPTDELDEIWQQIEPWSRLARRLNDANLAEALSDRSESTPPEDAPGLSAGDRELLQALPLAPEVTVEQLIRWQRANRAQLEVVRKVKRAGARASEPALRDAIAIAQTLLASPREYGLSRN